MDEAIQVPRAAGVCDLGAGASHETSSYGPSAFVATAAVSVAIAELTSVESAVLDKFVNGLIIVI